VDEPTEFDKIAGGDFGRRARVGPKRSGGRAAVPGREQSHPLRHVSRNCLIVRRLWFLRRLRFLPWYTAAVHRWPRYAVKTDPDFRCATEQVAYGEGVIHARMPLLGHSLIESRRRPNLRRRPQHDGHSQVEQPRFGTDV
jgi:hypothetical protein